MAGFFDLLVFFIDEFSRGGVVAISSYRKLSSCTEAGEFILLQMLLQEDVLGD
jgi:predicted proteasome-type protease